MKRIRSPRSLVDPVWGGGIGLFAIAAVMMITLAGCSRPLIETGSALKIVSRDRTDGVGLNLDDEFTEAIYRYEDPNSVTLLLLQGPRDAPERVLEVRMFWVAKAGATPIDRTATNTVVRLLEFRDSPDEPDALGLYAGAGFMRLHNDPTLDRVAATLWDADLRLTDRSEMFTDRLGRAILSGSLHARRDDARVTTVLRDLNQRVTDRLGYPRLVIMGRESNVVSTALDGRS